ncbi:MAG: UDP-N-acetylmuramate:L-alanyl-gamma-D-glutamyl-meso-diaminopimelate ligase [Candidatus Lambdaproteobacteria bacterium RIFOXYD2_FULL_50_16]|uniref:UDP-N-acetylmuramate:L-alanyl-gamma-D-glutamyl-meso-diaminopimelate ligase n=1 Tax=Candidatus Lambdaproteobacteria bacterium RIFOXYD2_FULL_50_16 TaxID=1817772 RepID=A0A1F6G7I2_9PROT|nr:MAG: UDP-N-acetylmuramate:L-alanyl-gamma-D-glutamyl-meso-diaminopimelate ligase [Candidatus Lambdaproteobacteria bacterium RIFOXYD2_FULL_50_16]
MENRHFHFSGICGTAMASLAVLLKSRGHRITGSDQNVYPPMSTLLEQNGIPIFEGYSANNLIPHPDVVVLGNALSRGNVEVEYALTNHLDYISMAELLKNEFIRGRKSIVITGTHGKTSTTSLAAHVFTACGQPTGFMVGGVPENFGVSSRDVEPGGYFVVEGDEYDTSLFDKRSKFFHYLPDFVVINNIEFDHADIFNNLEEIKRSFSLMLRQVPKDGLILANGDDAHAVEVAKSGYSRVVTFGMGPHCHGRIVNIKPKLGGIGMSFTLNYAEDWFEFEIPLFGEFNVRNAAAVILLALEQGIPTAKIQEALSSYRHVKRRLERINKKEAVKVFDDFAHHPTAIAETLAAVKGAWPEARIHAIYEPKSNTSVRKHHQTKMAPAFALADLVTFAPLYRAERLDPKERLDLDLIVQELSAQGKSTQILEGTENLAQAALKAARPGDIILVMSNGDFGGLQRRIGQLVDQAGF